MFCQLAQSNILYMKMIILSGFSNLSLVIFSAGLSGMKSVLYSQMFCAIFQLCAEVKCAALDENIANVWKRAA